MLAQPFARILAFAVDYLVIAAYIGLISGTGVVLRGTPLKEEFLSLLTSPLSAQLTVFLMLTLPFVLYFALLERSLRGTTLGACGARHAQ